MKLRLKKVSVLLMALLVTGSGATLALPERVGAANFGGSATAPMAASCAKLANIFGTVYKAQMIDDKQFGEPENAKKDDLLYDGTVVGTGNKSWAELQWPDVVTRIWSNSVVQVKPNVRQVVLDRGEIVFNLRKDRKDKTTVYDVRTKVLQARIHGTTVKVKATRYAHTIAVLEGEIYVTNLINKSVVRLTPGVVLEVKVDAFKGSGPAGLDALDTVLPATSTEKSTPNASQPVETSDMRLTPSHGELIFKDKYTTTQAYTANSKAILEDPMVREMGGPIESLPLIKEAVAKVPAFSLPEFIQETSKFNKIDKTISHNLKIVAVPSRTNYFIGPNVGQQLPLPAVAYTDLLPQGKIGDSTPIAPGHMAAVPVQAIRPGRIIDTPGGQLPDLTSVTLPTGMVNTSAFTPIHTAVTVNTAVNTQIPTQLPTAGLPIGLPANVTPFTTTNGTPGLGAMLSDRNLSDSSINLNVNLPGRAN